LTILKITVIEILKRLEDGIFTDSADSTIKIGKALALEIAPDTTIALYGDLGVGKTTLVKGIAKGLKIKKTITSPTFNLFSIYEGTWQLIHLDAYRLNKSFPLENLMLDDFINSPYCMLIEWPQNVPKLINSNVIKLKLSIHDDVLENKIGSQNSNYIHKIQTY
tara:strand:- start:5264 stop:5755 length:492 start_codon:yes stop_codon:yes gene_type:complete